jgi:small subunit ribosomal protein S12
MPTIQQLVRTGRTQITKKSKSVFRFLSSKKRGLYACLHYNTKKPNSAMRKVARVRLTNGNEVNAYIPVKDTPQEHSIVLVRGGKRFTRS